MTRSEKVTGMAIDVRGLNFVLSPEFHYPAEQDGGYQTGGK